MDLIKFFFTLSSNLKMYHWYTSSYSQHIATGNLFDIVISTTDKFMEIYFGKYGKNMIAPLDINVNFSTDETEGLLIEAVKYLRDIVKNGLIKPADTDLLNIRDELVGQINRTLYLLQLQ